MSAVISLPVNDNGYEYARIYKSDSLTGTYTLLTTVNSVQLEYEDPNGDHTSFYKVAWYDGTVESEQISVQSFLQKVIDIIRIECKVAASALPDSEIYFLLEEAKKAIKIDICTFKYGVQIYPEQDRAYYAIPRRYYFDRNFGGTVSLLDISLYKQAIPTYSYTPKEPVEILAIDFDEFYLKVVPLETTEVLKMSYFETGRELNPINLNTMIAYKICSMYYENKASSSISTASSSPFSKVQIGDITVNNGATSSSGTSTNAIIDLANKHAAKYTRLVKIFKNEFIRVN